VVCAEYTTNEVLFGTAGNSIGSIRIVRLLCLGGASCVGNVRALSLCEAEIVILLPVRRGEATMMALKDLAEMDLLGLLYST